MVNSEVQLVDTVGLAAYHDELMTAISAMVSSTSDDDEWEAYMNIAALRAQGYYLDSTVDVVPSYGFQQIKRLLSTYISYGIYDSMPNQYDFPNALVVGENAFRSNTTITQFYGDNVTRIESSAFEDAFNLRFVKTGALEYIGEYAFYSCYSLGGTIDISQATYIGSYAFANVSNLSYIMQSIHTLSNLTHLGANAFSYRGTNYNTTYWYGPTAFPAISSVPDSFYTAYMASSVGNTPYFEFPTATRVGKSAFRSAGIQASPNMPNVTYVDDYAFKETHSVSNPTTWLPLLTYVGTEAFALTGITGIVSLQHLEDCGSNAFGSTVYSFSFPNFAGYVGSSKFVAHTAANPSYYFPKAPRVEDYALSPNTYSSVRTVAYNFDSAVYVGASVFAASASLKYIAANGTITPDALILPNATSIHGEIVSTLSSSSTWGFHPCIKLISMPKLETIPESTFYYNRRGGFKSVYLPSLKHIGANAFYLNASISTFEAPNLETVDARGLFGCVRNTGVTTGVALKSSAYWSFSNLKQIGNSAFASNPGLNLSLDLTSCVSVGNNAFGDILSLHLTSTYWPSLEYIGEGAFSFIRTVSTSSVYDASSNLTQAATYSVRLSLPAELISIPEAETISSSAFLSQPGITRIHAHKISALGNHAFGYCTNLEELLLGMSTFDVGSYYSSTTYYWYPTSGCTKLRKVILPNISGSEIAGAMACFRSQYSANGFTHISMDKWIGDVGAAQPFYVAGSSSPASDAGSYAMNYPNATIILSSAYSSVAPLPFYYSFPNVTSIGQYAFYNTHISEINFPEATTIEWWCFNYCSYVEKIILPKVSFFSNSYSTSVAYRRGPFENMSKTCWYIDMRELVSTTTSSSPFSSCSFSWMRMDKWSMNFASTIFGVRKDGDVTAKFDNVDTIGTAAFSGVQGHLSLDFPKATTLGQNVFRNCPELRAVGEGTDVSLPSLTTIGSYAFAGCSNLSSVKLSNVTTVHPYAFSGCSLLNETNCLLPKFNSLPEGLWCGTGITNYSNSEIGTIPTNAFMNASSLVSVSVPNVTTINSTAFAETVSLTRIDLPKATTIGSCAFQSAYISSISLPLVTGVYGYAFRSASNLSSLDLPECSILYSYALEEASLTSVSLPKVVSVYSYAFRSCPLSTIKLPMATTFQTSAFGGWSGTTLELDASCTIGYGMFSGNSTISTLSTPNVSYVTDYAFSSTYNYIKVSVFDFPNITSLGGYCWFGNLSAERVNLGSSLTTMPSSTFRYAINLKSVCASGVTLVNRYAFYSCFSLNTVDLPEVRSIYSYAFGFCSSLSSIALPNVNYISANVFYSCWRLKTLDLRGVSAVPSLAGGTGIFTSTPFLGYSAYESETPQIIVPSSLYEAFVISTYWSTFSSYMVSV